MSDRSIRRWAVGITTAPRPQPTLARTCASLKSAGWSDYHVFEDVDRGGPWSNWVGGLRALVDRHSRADAYMMVQDDAVFCRDLRSYLERTLWPAAGVALCSPYCPAPYKRGKRGWHPENRGWYLVGAVCWAIPPEAARAILDQLGAVEARQRIDARVGRWAAESGRSVWYHSPSLVQHVGCGNSALGDPSAGPLRVAADFIGEENCPDPRRLVPGP